MLTVQDKLSILHEYSLNFTAFLKIIIWLDDSHLTYNHSAQGCIAS